MSNLDEQQILDALERVSQVESAPQATTRAIERSRQALAVASDSIGVKRRRPFIRFRMVKWLIPVAAAAAVVLAVIEFRPSPGGGHGGNGIVLADVINQLRSARSARITQTLREADPSGVVQGVVYMKEPDKIRFDSTQLKDGTTSSRFDGKRAVRLVSNQKLCYQIPATEIPGGSDVGELLVKWFRDLEVKPDGKGLETSTFGGKDARLVFESVQDRDGRKLLKYRVDLPTVVPFTSHDFCWFDAADKRLAMITVEHLVGGAWVEVNTARVEINIDLSDELFSTDVPPGYRVVSETGISRGMRDDLRDVLSKYEQGRDGIKRYRLVVWSVHDGEVSATGRALRDGSQWRCDNVWLPNETGRASDPRFTPESEFEAVWQRLRIENYHGTAMLCDGRVAAIERSCDNQGRTAGVTAVWGTSSPDASEMRLDRLGWPEWATDKSAVGEPDYLYHRLPDRPDAPGLIGVRIDCNTQYPEASTQPIERRPTENTWTFWIDPAKDWLCVRYEKHSRKGRPWQDNLQWQPDEPEVFERAPRRGTQGHDQVWEITEFGQTPDGRWYPKVVRRDFAQIVDGKRYRGKPNPWVLQLDTTGPINADLFKWPADVPKPEQDRAGRR